MTPKKKHWYDFLTKTTDAEVGPVKLKRIPVCIMIVIFASLLAVASWAFKIYMQTPEKTRHHKVDQIRGALK